MDCHVGKTDSKKVAHNYDILLSVVIGFVSLHLILSSVVFNEVFECICAVASGGSCPQMSLAFVKK